MIIRTNVLENKINQKDLFKRDYFYIDIDGIDYERLLLICAKVLIKFIGRNKKDIQAELKERDLMRVYYSSSKTGFHVKVNKTNNLVENLYYRSYFNDDRGRIHHDILRLNIAIPQYDIIFDSKTKKGKFQSKDHKQINLLKLTKISEKDFIDLCLLQDVATPKNLEKINNIMAKYKQFWETKILTDKKFEYSQKDITTFKRILTKYKLAESSDDKYITDKEIDLCKSIYMYAKTH